MTKLPCLLLLHGLLNFEIAAACSGEASCEETSLIQLQSIVKPGPSRSEKKPFDFVHEFMNEELSLIHDKPSRIAVASQCGGGYSCTDGWQGKAFKNHQEYAKKHGYEFFLLEQPLSERMKVWDRYPLISMLHKRGAEWVMYLDGDTLVMNTSVDADQFIKQHGSGKDLLISGDFQSHYQSGVFLMRNSERMRKNICNAWKICPSPKWQEQGAMMIVLGGGDPANKSTWNDAMHKLEGTGVTEEDQAVGYKQLPGKTQELLALLPQHLMDSYSEQARAVFPYWQKMGKIYTYTPGDWVVHFPGLPYKEQAVKNHLPFVSFLQVDKATPVRKEDQQEEEKVVDPFDCRDSSCCGPRVKVPESVFDCSDV
jgi:hypothetical protein